MTEQTGAGRFLERQMTAKTHRWTRRGPSTGQAVLWLIVLNVILRGAWLLWMHPPQLYDFAWYFQHAVWMLQGKGYVWNGHYTAYWPIGYPYFLSLLFHLTGPHVVAGLIANVILSLCTVLLVYGIGRIVLAGTAWPAEAGAFAGALGYSLLPSHIEWNAVLGSEELATFLLMLSLWIYLAWASRPTASTTDTATPNEAAPPYAVTLDAIAPNTAVQSAGGRAAATTGRWVLPTIAAGLCLGLSCDVRPIPLLFPVCIVLYERWSMRRSWMQALGRAMTFAIAMLIAVGPVTVRNHIAMHHFILVSTNGGVNLWQGTHANGAYFWSWNPKINPLLASHGNEILQNQIGIHAAVAYILHHPGLTIVNGIKKIFYLYWVDWNVVGVTFANAAPKLPAWVGQFASWFNTVVYWGFMGISLTGIVATLRRAAAHIALPIWYIVYNTAVFFFFPAWDRFRFPLMPLFAILFGCGWVWLFHRRRDASGLHG